MQDGPSGIPSTCEAGITQWVSRRLLRLFDLKSGVHSTLRTMQHYFVGQFLLSLVVISKPYRTIGAQNLQGLISLDLLCEGAVFER